MTSPLVIRYSAKSACGMPSVLCLSKLKPDYLRRDIESSILCSEFSSKYKLNYQAKF
jgi:hypothetical protein